MNVPLCNCEVLPNSICPYHPKIGAGNTHDHAQSRTYTAAEVAEHDEQLRQTFSKECARFHEEGHKCATCGREDLEEVKRQARLEELELTRRTTQASHTGSVAQYFDRRLAALRAEGAKT